jgi:hypothetical protein
MVTTQTADRFLVFEPYSILDNLPLITVVNNYSTKMALQDCAVPLKLLTNSMEQSPSWEAKIS